jgi:hypothetical protein
MMGFVDLVWHIEYPLFGLRDPEGACYDSCGCLSLSLEDRSVWFCRVRAMWVIFEQTLFSVYTARHHRRDGDEDEQRLCSLSN